MLHDTGTMTRAEGNPLAYDAIRAVRRHRLLAEMEQRGVDVLLVGRTANTVYAAGNRSLSLLGTRPFGPACAVVRATRDVHLLSISDDGIPVEIPHAHLFPLSWNPMNLMMRLAQIPGVTDARVVATDAMTPLMEQLLRHTLPQADLVDGDALLRHVRRTKTFEEVGVIRTACAVAEGALAAAMDAMAAGVTERRLLGAFESAMARLGVTTPGTEAVATVTTPRPGEQATTDAPRIDHLPSRRRLADGDLVALQGVVLLGGYEGGAARTVRCGAGPWDHGQQALADRGRRALDALVEQCAPGRTTVAFRRAWEATGERLPGLPIVTGVGLGMEPPVVGAGGPGPAGEGQVAVEEGMVLAVQSCVADSAVGTWFARETVLVTDAGPEVLTALA
jgi:Xaa-Pro aminopeptidase